MRSIGASSSADVIDDARAARVSSRARAPMTTSRECLSLSLAGERKREILSDRIDATVCVCDEERGVAHTSYPRSTHTSAAR